MPQDTTALEDGCISDQHFLALCESITEVRKRILLSRLEHFEEGLLASVFDSLDRIQHTFWHSNPEIVDGWYVMLDGLVGELSESVDDRTRIVVVSDHGIAEFNHKVHLNRWLIARGYLVPKTEEAQSLKEVDWSRSRAYAVGLNSLYVNLEGREKQGVVRLGHYQTLLRELQSGLSSWEGPGGQPVVRAARLREETFEGPLVEYGPDLVVGYAAGFRASSETGLGKWGANALVENEDHWRADHCMDHEVVPGVLFSNESLADYPHPSYYDIPVLTIGRSIEQDEAPPPQVSEAEDEEAVEERLKSLGYL
jgi:predicted AlkP superfamily phosphohydrolase/phosphomutase